MRTVYLDELLLLNVLVDYLLIAASARLAGEPLRRWRMALGALLGGAYAAASVLPGLGWLNMLPCKLGAALLMAAVGLGASRRLWRQTVIFLTVACAFAGAMFAVGCLGRGGAVRPTVWLILLFAAAGFAVFSVILRRGFAHSGPRGELVPVTLRLGRRQVSLTALVDTGSTLSDPFSGRGAVVVEASAVRELFGADAPRPQELADPAEAVRRLSRGSLRGRLSLLPYRAVGVEHGLLLAVRLDGARIGGRERGELLAAISPTPVSDGGGYRALVGEGNV